MIITIVFLGCLVAVCVLGIWIFRTRMIAQENQMMESCVTAMNELYYTIQNQIDMSRKFRHDLAKHIQTLEMLLWENSDNQDIRECVDGLKIEYRNLQGKKYCQDEIINSVLRIKEQQCGEKHIPLEIDVESVSYDLFGEVDKVGLIYNLLDNALEANERIADGSVEGRRGIVFRMGEEDGKIVIYTSNYVCPGEKITFQTSKRAREEHGIGTQIIDQLVKKYSGKKEIFYDKQRCLFEKKLVFERERSVIL